MILGETTPRRPCSLFCLSRLDLAERAGKAFSPPRPADSLSHNPLFVFFPSNGFFFYHFLLCSEAMSYLTACKSVGRLICHYLPAALLAFARANIPVAMEITSHASHTKSLAPSVCVLRARCERAQVMCLCVIRSQAMRSVNRRRGKVVD